MLRSLKSIIIDILAMIGFPISQKWKPLIESYHELRALKFSTEKDADKAIEILYTPTLHNCPHDFVGDNTIIVPAEAVRHFRKAKLNFKDTRVIPAGELPAEEIYKLRREQGTF